MKKSYFSILVVAVMIFGIALEASAQTMRPQMDRQSYQERLEAQRQEMEERRRAIQAEAEERRQEVRQVIESRRSEVENRRPALEAGAETRERSVENQERRVGAQQKAAKRQIENLARVVGATIERLEKIGDRIESRINKLEDTGATGESKRYLALARTDLEEARASLSTFGSIDLSSEMGQDNFQRVRSAAAETREHIRSAHQNLVMAIRSLAGVQALMERSVEKDEVETDETDENEETEVEEEEN